MTTKRTYIAWGLFLLTPILLHPSNLRAQTTSWGSGSGGGSFSVTALRNATTCVDAGANDTYTCDLSPAIASYAEILHVPIGVKFNTANTGAATLNINGVGAQAVVNPVFSVSSNALATGAILAGATGVVQWDGTNFRLISVNTNIPNVTGNNTYTGGNTFNGTANFGSAINVTKTLTPGGTTGAQTINNRMGTVNFAAAAATLVVTNSTALTTSVIFLTPQTADTTCIAFSAVRAAGSFTITANAACTAETAVGFLVLN